jgi:hypothetical protein
MNRVILLDWLSSTGRSILTAVVDNRECYRVECDHKDVEVTAELMFLDLDRRHPPIDVSSLASVERHGLHLVQESAEA